MNKNAKTFAGDAFFTAGGKLDVSSTQPLTVAYIGGSLTEGEVDYEGTSLSNPNLKWANILTGFLSGLFPFRPIKAVNAGLGGTGSQYGAARFSRNILAYEPDLIFIEFSCNDSPFTEEECNEEGKNQRQIWLESMIRQCMMADKVPAVVYTHVPVPYEENVMPFFRRGCEFKQEVLDHYEIGTIDAMADVMHEFEALRLTDPTLTRKQFLGQYYEQYADGTFNVHPYASGYVLFAMSIINAITKDPERYLRPFKMTAEPYCKNFTTEVNLRYNSVPAASDRITYEGDWTLYTSEKSFISNDPTVSINTDRYVLPHQFPEGIMQTEMPKNASFSFETEADRICMPHISAKAGLSATVYANGQEVGTTTCSSPWHGMNYTGPWITLPKGKKQVRFEVENAGENATVFRFGYIIEAFENNTL